MPTAKSKGGGAVHRYRPASEYDNATLAQKREYWRNKKREQRARLSERRGKLTRAIKNERLPHLHTLTESNNLNSVSCSFKDNESFSCAPLSGDAEADRSFDGSESQNGKWLQTANLNKVLPTISPSHAVSGKPAGNNTAALKYPATRSASSRTTSSGSEMNISSLVTPVRVTRTINGSSTEKAAQPYASMQGAFVPKPQDKSETRKPIQSKCLPTHVAASIGLVSSACDPVSVKSEGETVTTTCEVGAKSALVIAQRLKGNVQPSLESEEEKAAKRREHWRIKKREQRAKLAAQLHKTRERKQGAKVAFHRQTAPGGGLKSNLIVLPSQPVLTRPSSRHCPSQVTFVKREDDKLQSEPDALAGRNLQPDLVKLPHSNQTAQSKTVDGTFVRRPLESLRKLPNHVYVNSVSRGLARCKTPRQRFIDAQKTYMNLRNLKCKSFVSSVFGPRCMPGIDPGDTPEQIVAKRREYWRIKKREQRAKLSVEVKARLKEKDSLMRRVKRYQNILEEMRKTRAPTRSNGGTLTHASETIGGFIKEDGTLTVNIPQGPTDHGNATNKGEKMCHMVGNQPDTKPRGVDPIRIKPPPPPLCPQVRVSFPLAVQSANKHPSLLSIIPQTSCKSTTAANSQSFGQSIGQLTLTHPQPPQDQQSRGPAADSSVGGCVMKMVVSCSTSSLSALPPDPELTEEDKMAKKREYWRIKKREQRAARAFRLKQGVFQARTLVALQRRKVQKQAPSVPRSPTNCTGSAHPPSTNSTFVFPHANEIKQESESPSAADLNSQLEQAICPDIKAPTSPVPLAELDPTLSVDSQATTLLAVASMKKLLEESLSTVTENRNSQTDIKMEATEEVSEEDMKPHLPQLFCESNDMPPITADLTLQIKSWQSEDLDVMAQVDPTSPLLKKPLTISETSPPLPPSCEHSYPTPPSFTLTPTLEESEGLSPPHLHIRTSPETPQLYENQTVSTDQLDPQHRHDGPEQRSEEAPEDKRVQPVMSSLQRKREYWKLMKRQQRARLKARQKDQTGGNSRQRPPENIQTPGLVMIMPKQPAAPRAASNKIAAVLLIPPPIPEAPTSPHSLLNLPPTRTDTTTVSGGAAPPAAQLSPQWVCESTDSAPCLPTLKPPDNPLSRINLQPIEPSFLCPIKIPCPQLQSPAHVLPSPTKLVPMSTMVPPKPILGESEEDFLRRKREYWRIKKKEQRARKAIREKESPPKRASNGNRHLLPTEDPESQDCGQRVNFDESQHLIRLSMDSELGFYSYSDYTAPVEDESEFLFSELESHGGDEASVSDGVWRSRYLMDYEPLNQLLVCMVCGELQYSHSLEAVRAHIDEAHPHTLGLDSEDKRHILEAWDEQVSQRERFFTSQLQQHGGAAADAQRN